MSVINNSTSLAQTGVLLINLGTPSAPTTGAVRRYLQEFLSDTRVVELSRWLWLPLLYGIVLVWRPAASAKKYQKIWTERGSPLLFHTQDQAAALQQEFLIRGRSHLHVAYAMRYGRHSISHGIEQLVQQGCTRIIGLPLYPQYAASSTGSALDGVYQAMMLQRNMPALHIIKSYEQNPSYIKALEMQIRRYWQQHGRGEHLVMSFHGVPIATIEKGDPYFDHCLQTAHHLAAALELDKEQYTVAFQSRFGKAEWLKPATNATLTLLAQAGVKKLDIVCPGFIADCLETLEEIAIEGREVFEASGGMVYHYIPCLNTNQEWIQALADICQQEAPNWLETCTPSINYKINRGNIMETDRVR